VEAESIEIAADEGGRWSVAVSIPADAMIGVSVSLGAEE
jgi:hypothetical protein